MKNYDLLDINGKSVKVQDVASVYLGYAQQAKKSFVMDPSVGESQNALSFQIKKSP